MNSFNVYSLQHPPAEGLPATASDLRTIAISVNAFLEHIGNVKSVEKAQTAIRLNAAGNSRIEYKVGDQVGFYLPPDDKAARAMQEPWVKSKNICCNTLDPVR